MLSIKTSLRVALCALFFLVTGNAIAVTPQVVTYTDTSLLACPIDESLRYFWTGSSDVEYRAQSWCGAAQKDIDQANIVDPNTWRRPYILESCSAGVNWFYSHRLSDTERYYSPANRDINMVCVRPCPAGMTERGGICVKTVTINNVSTQAPSDPKTCDGLGNPIFPLTGVKKDFVSTGMVIGGQELTLIYDTTLKAPASQGNVDSGYREPRAFGTLWKTSFHRKLLLAPDGLAAVLRRGDSSVLNFSGNGAGVYTPEPSNPHKLQTVTGGYLFTDVNTGVLETFDTDGNLTQAAAANGVVHTFSYTNGELIRVQANDGRAISFSYDDGRITRVIGPDRGIIVAAYDINKNLTSLTWADGKAIGLLYEDTNSPWALTGKVDENNSRLATFAYDSRGRAISSEHAGGAQRYTVDYGSPPQVVVTETFDEPNSILYRILTWQPAAGISVTGPNMQASAWESQLVQGRPVITSRSQSAGSGCLAAGIALAYDDVGNVVSKDDASGVRSCYAYDSSNHETVRVEGLSPSVSCATVTPTASALPSGSRKITTTWHPDWQMPAVINEPLRRNSTVYHGQPDPFNGNVTANCTSASVRADGKPLPLVCKQVVQALLASGAVDTSTTASVVAYTYDANGRMLTTVDNGMTTTYAYYSTSTFPAPGIGSVVLLLHGNGPNGTTTFIDSSPLAQTVTAVGNASVSTSQSKFGSGSIALDGAGDYLIIGASDSFNFGTADFTVEMFVYLTETSSQRTLISNYADASTGWSILTYAGKYNFNCAGDPPELVQVGTIPASTWHHLAVTRANGTFRLFIDGVLDTSYAVSKQCNSTAPLTIGRLPYINNYYYTGYIDDVRVTKGGARYTSNFTPPSQQLPDADVKFSDTGHSVGDLQSVTNAVGQTVRMNLYDPVGRVRQMTDAKNVVTDISYTPRGWVGTVTVTPPSAAARTTTYSYDNAGQRTAAVLPDGTSLSYSYDAAHRLTGVTDTLGNAITYTLDAQGNRVVQEMRDPGGVLRRSVSRSFDALNRLQQATGAAN